MVNILTSIGQRGCPLGSQVTAAAKIWWNVIGLRLADSKRVYLVPYAMIRVFLAFVCSKRLLARVYRLGRKGLARVNHLYCYPCRARLNLEVNIKVASMDRYHYWRY